MVRPHVTAPRLLRTANLRVPPTRSIHFTSTHLRPEVKPGVTPTSEDPAEDPKKDGTGFFAVSRVFHFPSSFFLHHPSQLSRNLLITPPQLIP